MEPPMRVELMTSFLPRTRSTTELQGRTAATSDALLAAGAGLLDWCTGQDSNLRSRKAADLQSAGISHSPTRAGCLSSGQRWLLVTEGRGRARPRVGAREGI